MSSSITCGCFWAINFEQNLKKKNRLHAGATGGIVLVNVKSQVSLVGSNSEAADQSGNDFVGKPFV
jgi:hypothetical protein